LKVAFKVDNQSLVCPAVAVAANGDQILGVARQKWILRFWMIVIYNDAIVKKVNLLFSHPTEAEVFTIGPQSVDDERTLQDGIILLDKQASICDNVCSNQGLG
jgi:hypothetical protein